MKTEIRDRNGEIMVALRGIGMTVDKVSLEKVLNIVELIRTSKEDVTLKEIFRIAAEVEVLFTKAQQQPEK